MTYRLTISVHLSQSLFCTRIVDDNRDVRRDWLQPSLSAFRQRFVASGNGMGYGLLSLIGFMDVSSRSDLSKSECGFELMLLNYGGRKRGRLDIFNSCVHSLYLLGSLSRVGQAVPEVLPTTYAKPRQSIGRNARDHVRMWQGSQGLRSWGTYGARD